MVDVTPEGRPFGCFRACVEEGVADIGSAVECDDLKTICKTDVQRKVYGTDENRPSFLMWHVR